MVTIEIMSSTNQLLHRVLLHIPIHNLDRGAVALCEGLQIVEAEPREPVLELNQHKVRFLLLPPEACRTRIGASSSSCSRSGLTLLPPRRPSRPRIPPPRHSAQALHLACKIDAPFVHLRRHSRTGSLSFFLSTGSMPSSLFTSDSGMNEPPSSHTSPCNYLSLMDPPEHSYR